MKVWTDDYGIRATRSRPMTSYPLRRTSIAFRCLLTVCTAGNLAYAALNFTTWHPAQLAVNFIAACICAGCFALLCWSSGLARSRAIYANRPRPDYSLIASMEREVYGEAFSHDGAPVPVVSRSFVSGPARTYCADGHPQTVARGRCPECHEAVTLVRHFGAGDVATTVRAKSAMSDDAFLAMMAGATFGPDATVVMPSGKTVTGTEMTALLGLAQP